MQYKSIIATNRSLTFWLVAEGKLLSEVLIGDLGVEGNRERSTKASGSSGTRLVHSEAVEGVVEFLRSSIGSGNKLMTIPIPIVTIKSIPPAQEEVRTPSCLAKSVVLQVSNWLVNSMRNSLNLWTGLIHLPALNSAPERRSESDC